MDWKFEHFKKHILILLQEVVTKQLYNNGLATPGHVQLQ